MPPTGLMVFLLSLVCRTSFCARCWSKFTLSDMDGFATEILFAGGRLHSLCKCDFSCMNVAIGMKDATRITRIPRVNTSVSKKSVTFPFVSVEISVQISVIFPANKSELQCYCEEGENQKQFNSAKGRGINVQSSICHFWEEGCDRHSHCAKSCSTLRLESQRNIMVCAKFSDRPSQECQSVVNGTKILAKLPIQSENFSCSGKRRVPNPLDDTSLGGGEKRINGAHFSTAKSYR